tara:strand:+ start:125 stop:541 length:417 start_codon:yes stop_codon:yes gene_type:complete
VQFFLQLLLSWALSLLQLFSLLLQLDLAHDVEQQLPIPEDMEHELKNNEKLNNEINNNDFFIKTPYFLAEQGLPSSTTPDLSHADLQDFIQQTALHTPQQKTPTKTTFKANSIQSFQQLQFLQSILKLPFYFKFNSLR